MCETNNSAENRNDISRYKMREQAFILCFEMLFSDADVDELAENAGEARDEFLSDYAVQSAKGVKEHIEAIDARISENLKSGWKISRISRVSLAILRLAVYEILFIDDIPVSVSINEAVELSKKYTVQDDTSFINGVLGSIARAL